MPFVTYIPMSTVAVPASVIANLCQRFGSSTFTLHNYDLLRCNCNHFTQAVLERYNTTQVSLFHFIALRVPPLIDGSHFVRLGLVYSMPRWINRYANCAVETCFCAVTLRLYFTHLFVSRVYIVLFTCCCLCSETQFSCNSRRYLVRFLLRR